MLRRVTVLILVPGLLLSCAAPSKIDPKAVAATAPPSVEQSMERLQKISSHFQRTPFLPGNAVQLLQDGPPTYAAMTAAIQQARTRIDMESYQFDTATAASFADLLLQKSQEGVAVHLIYDAWGSIEAAHAMFDRLRSGGVQVVEYNPLGGDGKLSLDVDRRDHRKLLVVDGRVAITGGVNITKAYLNAPGGSSTDPDRMAWRDTDVQIEGPVVAQFQALFDKTWQAEHGPALPPPPPTPGYMPGHALVQAIDGAPVDDHPVIYETLLSAVALARISISFTTGFFAPTSDMDEALEDAARRGVEVALVVPAHSTSDAAIIAGRSHYTDLLEAGVKIYERQGVVLHAKTAVVDGLWSTVGSSNLDWRSAVLNNEIDAVVLDADFGAAMETMFAADVAASQQITRDAWARRGLGERIGETWAKMVERVL